jgi:hypothetical protein
LTSDNIEAEIIRNYLLKRDDDAAQHGSASATNSTTTTIGKAAAATTSSTGPQMIGKSVQTVPDILQTGTLFYIGISVTTLLWVTGKAIDVKMERQERYAESLIHSI